MVVMSAILTSIIGLLQAGADFGVPELKQVGLVAFLTGLTYLNKKLFSDSDGKIVGKF